MEEYLTDIVVKNVLFKKMKIQTQLNTLHKIFKQAFNDIDEVAIEKRMKTVNEYIKILDTLKKQPVIKQRSEEWYNIRNTLITASDFGQALKKGKFGSQKDFIKKKCGYETQYFDSSIPAIQWGVRYEEVANMFYKMKYEVEVHEFGLLAHPKHKFIGASPDGISDLGIMLEIKCPFKRKRTDTIPDQYYYQVQGQLEVCDLYECDYLECYITEYDDYESMINDTECSHKGQVWVLPGGEYEYGNINEFYKDKTCKCYHYGIKDYFIKRVRRDKEFFNEIFPQIKNVWETVLAYRNNRYEYDNYIKSNERQKQKVFKFRTDVGDDDII